MTHHQPQTPHYPLRFEPIYQYRLRGGWRLAVTVPLPVDGPIGEAWILSDYDNHPSRVAGGALRWRTIAELLEQFPETQHHDSVRSHQAELPRSAVTPAAE
ncbi:MAG: hypothetical protein R2729_03730 [Bryobacteraceae bacterium]